MKIEIHKTPDFDNEIIDVSISIDGSDCWVKGFDGVDWEEADKFANELATQLNLKIVNL